MWNFILYRTVPYSTVPTPPPPPPPQIPTNLPLKNVPEDFAVEGDVEAGRHGDVKTDVYSQPKPRRGFEIEIQGWKE